MRWLIFFKRFQVENEGRLTTLKGLDQSQTETAGVTPASSDFADKMPAGRWRSQQQIDPTPSE